MPAANRAALLARVSTLKASQDESPESQLERLRHYAAAKGWAVATEKIERVSGSKGERERPALAEIMNLARAGKVDVIVATKMDRLGRNLLAMLTMAEELHALGVEVVFTEQAIDTTTPTGRLVWAVIAAINQWQREEYAERAIAGKHRAEGKGIHCACPREPVQAEALALVEKWMRQGKRLTWRAASAELFRLGYRQPARYIKTRGTLRSERPWNPGTLYKAWLAKYPQQKLVIKPPLEFAIVGQGNSRPEGD